MHDVRWRLAVAHRERLLRLARRRCATPEDAEDVVQEALLRAATFSDLDEARIGPFLTSVTVRLCADARRAADRAARTAGRLAQDRAEPADPADLACRDADARRLADLLDRLPDRQREVLADRAAGLSVGQISVRRTLTYKATESALARARAALRLALRSVLGLLWLLGVRRRGAALAVPAVATLALLAMPARPLPPTVPPVPTQHDQPPAPPPLLRFERASAPAPPPAARHDRPRRPAPPPSFRLDRAPLSPPPPVHVGKCLEYACLHVKVDPEGEAVRAPI